jgi:hypothetical protein
MTNLHITKLYVGKTFGGCSCFSAGDRNFLDETQARNNKQNIAHFPETNLR